MARRPISGWFSHGRKDTRGSGTTRRRPRLESLEGRQLLSAGDLDPTFGTNGQTIVAFDKGRTNTDINYASAVQSWDSKIVSVGVATFPGENDADFAITRLLPDGQPDTGFGLNGDGKVTVDFDEGAGRDDGARAVAIQPDHRIVVAGWCQRNDGNYDFAVLRLNPDGSRDTTFGPNRDGRARISFDWGGDRRDVATAVAIRDGKIVVAGDVRSSWGQEDTDFGVARLTSFGLLDTSFGYSGKTVQAFDRGGNKVDHPVGVAIQSSGKIVVAGTVQMDAAGDTDFGVIRLNPDGSLDDGFGSPSSESSRAGMVTVRFSSDHDNANAMTLQGDKIVIVGEIERGSASDYDFGVARLTADGRLDSTFGSAGLVRQGFDMAGFARDFATAVAVRGDKIVVAGAIEMDGGGNFDFGLIQLTDSGALDTSFGGNNPSNTPGLTTLGLRVGGRPTEDTPRGLAFQGDRLVASGTVRPIGGSDSDFGVIRVEAIDPPPPPPSNDDGSGGGNPGGGSGGGGGGNDGSGGGNQGGGGSGGGNPGGGGSGGGGSGNGNPGNGGSGGGNKGNGGSGGGNQGNGSSGGNQGNWGSGGGKVVDPPPPVPRDQTPPTIVAGQRIYSGSGRKRKVVGFKLFFSEAIDPATAAMGNFTVAAIKAVKRGVVKASPVGAITSFYDPFDYSVSILTAPKAKFPRGAQVTVGAGVRDTAGNAIRTAAFNVL